MFVKQCVSRLLRRMRLQTSVGRKLLRMQKLLRMKLTEKEQKYLSENIKLLKEK